MTIIYENFTDIASMPDQVAVTFFGVPLRMNFDDDGVITPRPIEAETVNGVATSPELDPGPCRVEVCTDDWRETYDVMIPESGTHRLFELEEIIISAHKVIVQGPKGDTGAGVALSGSVPTYADLGPGPWDLGTAFVVNADGLLYIYGALGWPANGEGAAFRGAPGLSVNSVAITGNQLAFGLQDGTALPKVTVPALAQAAADATAAAASRTAADSAKVETLAARDATLTTKGQVDTARTDVLAAKTSVDGSATSIAADKSTVITARDATVAAKGQAEGFASTASAQAGASAASATASSGFAGASQTQADRAFAEADRAEAAADEIATGAVADNAISTIKVQDGAVTKPKLGASVQASLDKADSAVQGSDARLSDARTPTAHTHTIGNITGLRTALDGKGTSNLTLGTTGTTAAAGNDARLSDARAPAAGTVPYDITFVAQSSNRATGLGDVPAGIKLRRAVTFSEVLFHCETADASGNLVVEVRKNGAAVSGTSTTVAAANQVAGGTSTGTWAFAAGDFLTINVTAVGTTPGKGVTAELKGLC